MRRFPPVTEETLGVEEVRALEEVCATMNNLMNNLSVDAQRALVINLADNLSVDAQWALFNNLADNLYPNRDKKAWEDWGR